MSDAPAPPSDSAPGGRVSAVIVLLTAAFAYANSLSGPLVFDDAIAINGNPSLESLWASLHPPAANTVGGRPFLNLTFALNFVVHGNAVLGYHLVNAALHALAGLALLGVARRTQAPLVGHAAWLALALAALWTAHPVQTATVTYISQRAELLMGLCYLSTLYAFVRGAGPKNSPMWLGASVAVCALGMAAKEVMVTAPLLVLLYDRTFVAGTFAAAWRARRVYYAGLAATWILLGSLLATDLELRQVGYDLGVSLSRYALTECHALLVYLRLVVWPHPLVFDYGAIFSVPGARSFAEALVVGSLIAATLVLLVRRPRLGFLPAAFFLLLAPTSSVVPIALQPIAENRLYLPLAAALALLVLAVHALAGRRALAVGLVAWPALIALTWHRNETYRTAVGLWADNVAHRPENVRGYEHYALSLKLDDRPVEAARAYEAALRLDPSSAINHAMLGVMRLSLGHPEEAVLCYQRALALKPALTAVRSNLGTALMQLGRIPDAIAHLRSAIHIHPTDADAYLNLALAYGKAHDPANAERALRTAVAVRPDRVDLHVRFAEFLLDTGATEEAVGQYRDAIRRLPRDGDLRLRLGAALAAAGQPEAALPFFEEGLRLTPASAAGHNEYGAALYRLGRPAEAAAEFERALALQPDYAIARNNLAIARAASPASPRE